MRTAVWNLSGMQTFSKIIALWECGWQQLLQLVIFTGISTVMSVTTT